METIIKDQATEKTLVERAEDAAFKAEQAAKRIEEANKEADAREARRILGGRSEAGKATQELTQEAKKVLGAKEFFKGSIVEKAIDKYGQK